MSDSSVDFHGRWVPSRASVTFEGFLGELQVREHGDVPGVIDEVESRVCGGEHAVGYISYEAAPGFDAALITRPPGDTPLLWFAFFRQRRERKPPTPSLCQEDSVWSCSLERDQYDRALGKIADYIVAGDTYQANFTMKMRAAVDDADAMYGRLCRAQGEGYFARIQTADHLILSASPELFFSIDDSYLTTRPMKGTRPRGRSLAEDAEFARELAISDKERAENVMITDLLRNDMGRVSVPGSVTVPRLWDVERYETVWQMTSTIRSQLAPETSLVDLLRALFPCGSVTGAPKVRTMQILSQLESEPRGVYTGAIGVLSPRRTQATAKQGRLAGLTATFSVAIRTICVERQTGNAEFGVGSGVTHGSVARLEYDECMTKTRVLSTDRPRFRLLETMLFDPLQGIFLLKRHLRRLLDSARYFGFPCDIEKIERALASYAKKLSATSRVRFTLGPSGELEIGSVEIEVGRPKIPLRAALVDDPVDSGDPFLCHKTTHRQVYDSRREQHRDCEEIILMNERGELTECSTGNLVISAGGVYYTPSASSGLLPGTFRAFLLETGQLSEQVLCADDLVEADGVFIINSVRRWVPLEVITAAVVSTGVAEDGDCSSAGNSLPSAPHQLRETRIEENV